MVDFAPLFRQLQAEGYTPTAAAGILGNFGQESNFNPAAIGDNGTSGGLGQWHNERLAALKAFGGQNWQSPLIQLQFANQEIRANPKLFNALQAAATPTQAADIFSAQYERPNPVYANNAHREAIANEVAGENQGQGPTRVAALQQFGTVGLPAAPPQSPASAAPSATPASPGQALAGSLIAALPKLAQAQRATAPTPQPSQTPLQTIGGRDIAQGLVGL